MIVPGLYRFARPLLCAFITDPVRECLYDRQFYRRWRGGIWYNALPFTRNRVAGDRLGWRTQPAKADSHLIEMEQYTRF
jgi:hypothetical protein